MCYTGIMKLKSLEKIDELTEAECREWLNAFNTLYEPIGFRDPAKSPQFTPGSHHVDVMRRAIKRAVTANPDWSLVQPRPRTKLVPIEDPNQPGKAFHLVVLD